MAILTDLLSTAERMPRNAPSWLLEASALSEAIGESIIGDPAQLDAVRRAVRKTADDAGCDLIVGASGLADQIVRGLNQGHDTPSRALLFEIVRITGSTISQALGELRHVDVVTAVLVDMQREVSTDRPTRVSIACD